MAAKTEHVCTECGHIQAKWAGQCPDCKGWNSFEERQATSSSGAGKGIAKGLAKGGASSSQPAAVHSLGDHNALEYPRFSTGAEEVDRVLGGGVVPGSVLLLSGEPGAGKALPLSTEIATPNGWSTMKDLRVGDSIFNELGKVCHIEVMTRVQNNRPVYEITFDDGTVQRADANHLWKVTTGRMRGRIDAPERPWRGAQKAHQKGDKWDANVSKDGKAHYLGVYDNREEAAEAAREGRKKLGVPEYNSMPKSLLLSTEEIVNTLSDNPSIRYYIESTAPLDLPEKHLPIHPYVLGLWLGDGNSHNGIITNTQDPDIVARIEDCGLGVVPRKPSYRLEVVGLKSLLKDNDLLNNKHVPEDYLRGSEKQRRSLLSGLMDSDGTSGKRNSPSALFTNKNKKLIDAALELAISLGYRARIRWDDPVWRMAYCAYDQSPFKLERKASKWKPSSADPTRGRYIQSVDLVESEPVKCLQVSSPSGMFLAGRAMLPTHNSTIMSATCDYLAANDKRVLYVAGEESGQQIRLRTDRMGLSHSDKIDLTSDCEVGAVCSRIASGYDFAVIDSIQTLWDSELSGAPGSVSIVKSVGQALVRTAKESGCAVLIVGHVNKDGNLAGPRHLEHLVDGFLALEGERSEAYRILRAQKNRFGATDEIGIFEMTSKGLLGVSDPASIFLSDHSDHTPGSVICPTLEGTRPMLIEVQALASPTHLPTPMRRSRGIDKNRLDLLLAVLGQRSGWHLKLGTRDVYMNISGGIKIEEPALDLAACVAVASAATGRPVRKGIAVFGEVSLLGEVRPVQGSDRRMNEAKRMGFSEVIAGPGQGTKSVKTLKAALAAALEKEPVENLPGDDD